MINISELRPGNVVQVEYESKIIESVVIDINHPGKQVCVQTGEQQYWFEPEHLSPVPISDAQLQLFNFKIEELPNRNVKYSKDSFRLVIPKKDDFSSIEMWYREDKRHHPDVRYIHQLQNHYHQMTKVDLDID